MTVSVILDLFFFFCVCYSMKNSLWDLKFILVLSRRGVIFKNILAVFPITYNLFEILEFFFSFISNSESLVMLIFVCVSVLFNITIIINYQGSVCSCTKKKTARISMHLCAIERKVYTSELCIYIYWNSKTIHLKYARKKPIILM